MDPLNIRKNKSQTLLKSSTLYNFDNIRLSNRKIPQYLKEDGHYHTNAEINVRFLRTYSGAILPYMPSDELASTSKRNKSSFKFTENLSGNTNEIISLENSAIVSSTKSLNNANLQGSSRELRNYFQNIQYHSRDVLPPISK